MSKQSDDASSREVVLNAAEELFALRGYATVTLKDIAKQLGIKQASLYYHVPGGKEDLFVEVMVRHLERHRQALEAVRLEAASLEECLFQMATWFLSQPPLNTSRMFLTDLPELTAEKADQLESAVYCCVFAPVEQALLSYQSQLQADAGLIAGIFISSVQALHLVQRYGSSQQQLIAGVIAVLLHGGYKA